MVLARLRAAVHGRVLGDGKKTARTPGTPSEDSSTILLFSPGVAGVLAVIVREELTRDVA
jgi:hypothetical protein